MSALSKVSNSNWTLYGCDEKIIKCVGTDREVLDMETRVCGRQKFTNATLETVASCSTGTLTPPIHLLSSLVLYCSASQQSLLCCSRLLMFGVSLMKHEDNLKNVHKSKLIYS